MREVHPLGMPSPELLHCQGHPGLEHIAEGLNAEWTKCLSLCGLKSIPDATHGVSRFAFSSEGREKLTSKNTCACEKMILPFYIGEAKSSERLIEEAELQAMHSASVAGNAVIELFQNVSAAEQLTRRVLNFSLSHNPILRWYEFEFEMPATEWKVWHGYFQHQRNVNVRVKLRQIDG